MRFAELPERIKSKIAVEPNSGCWLWIGSLFLSGYARMMVAGKFVRVHRLIYEFEHEPATSLHHRCDTKCCVNPEHLEPIDHSDHMTLHRVARTHCSNGHSLNDSYFNGRQVICRACHRESSTRRRRKLGIPIRSESSYVRQHGSDGRFSPTEAPRQSY